MFCSKCGSQVDGGGNFCRYCGARITRQYMPVPDVNVYPTPAQTYPDPARNVPDVRIPASPSGPDSPDNLPPGTPSANEILHFSSALAQNPQSAQIEQSTQFMQNTQDITPGVSPEEASLFPENEQIIEPQTASFSVQPGQNAEPVISDFTNDGVETDFTTEEGNSDIAPECNKLNELNELNPPEAAAIPEKVYFGKPALVFCLVIIGILSVACGVLTSLYFGVV